jgi:hypothetical protein
MKKLGVIALAVLLSMNVYARGGGGGGGGHGGGGHASGHAGGEGHSNAHFSESEAHSSGHSEEAPHVIRPIYVAHGTSPESVCKDGVAKVDDSSSQTAVTCKEKESNTPTIVGLIVVGFVITIVLAIATSS